MKKIFASLGVLAAVVVGTTAVTFAAIPDTSGTIHSCYNNGLVPTFRIINSSSQSCTGLETSLTWSQTGGSYIGTLASDTIVTNSSGIVTDGHTGNLVATCDTNGVAVGGYTKMTGDSALISAVAGYTSARQGFAQGFASWADDAATGITIGADAGVNSASMTISLYPICTTVPSIPS